MKPSPGATAQVLKSVERNFPRFNADKEMNAMCLVNMAHVTGVVAAWFLHNQGEAALDKALAMIVTTIRKEAYDGEALIREKKSHMLGTQ
jgi:glycine/serine hydroxymethyltransferase